MVNVLKPDICVIGAGSGGLSVAAAAAAFGVRVVLIEKGRMGGDCLNYGCVPSKALIAAGKHADALRHGAGFGIADVEPEIDFRKVAEHVQSVIAAIAPNNSAGRFTRARRACHQGRSPLQGQAHASLPATSRSAPAVS